MKVLIFSHIADPDGITPIILSKLAFEQVDYKLLDNPLDEYFLNYLKKCDIKSYDKIFMTDLCVSEETILFLSENFKNKFLVFDHHKSNSYLNKYNFINVIDEIDGKKESGTSLYYNYLIENYNNELLDQNSTRELVNLVRLGDTWQWELENKPEALYLSDYLSIVGISEYINYFYNFIKNNNQFYFEDKIKYLFEVENKRKELYIEEKEKQIIHCFIKPYNVGIVFAENYRSILGNKLAKKNEAEFDFIIIINLARSISYRGVKDVDLSKFAEIYGGKGHKNAAGSPLPNGLRNKIIQEIYKDAKIME